MAAVFLSDLCSDSIAEMSAKGEASFRLRFERGVESQWRSSDDPLQSILRCTERYGQTGE